MELLGIDILMWALSGFVMLIIMTLSYWGAKINNSRKSNRTSSNREQRFMTISGERRDLYAKITSLIENGYIIQSVSICQDYQKYGKGEDFVLAITYLSSPEENV